MDLGLPMGASGNQGPRGYSTHCVHNSLLWENLRTGSLFTGFGGGSKLSLPILVRQQAKTMTFLVEPEDLKMLRHANKHPQSLDSAHDPSGPL